VDAAVPVQLMEMIKNTKKHKDLAIFDALG
jgi:hypothetical protein